MPVDPVPALETVVGWESDLAALAGRWLQVRHEGERRQAQNWSRDLARLRDEMRSAQASGRWRTGPADMLGVLERDRSELSHSRMLSWLLDPLGQHGLQARFAAELLWAAGLGVPPDLDFAIVKLEVARTESRADVVVELPSGGFVIENKVDAVESPAQCERIASDYPSASVGLIFLSPSGRPPVTAGSSAPRWHTLSWRSVRIALEATAGIEAGAGGRVVGDYLTTLRRIFR